MADDKALYHLENGGLTFSFHGGGDLYRIVTSGGIMVNQLLSHEWDGALNNLYLRVHTESGIQAYPMLGIQSGSSVSFSQHQAMWKGEAGGISYSVRFVLTKAGIWFWEVRLEGNGELADVLYGQDVGLATVAAVRSNEAYLSQYIDHTVFRDEERGFVVCSRQNQPQNGLFPALEQGALTESVGYSTDGFQFFGLSYKETDRPEGWYRSELANEIYQYEFAYTALQSPRRRLDGEVRYVFYGRFNGHQPGPVTGASSLDEVKAAWKDEPDLTEPWSGTSWRRTLRSPDLGAPLAGDSFNRQELDRLFPQRFQEEYEGDTLLSFFKRSYEHVVLKEKELRVERPHGHILMSGGNDRMNSEVLSSTGYMFGVFNSQLVVGNTSFNKMMAHTRNPLNLQKATGQRIHVLYNGEYRLLTMPSAFEMGFNYGRWYYKLPDDLLTVTVYTRTGSPELILRFKSSAGKPYRCLVTGMVTMNVNEFEVPYHCRQEGDEWVYTADPASLSAGVYPDLAYRLAFHGTVARLYGEERLLVGAAESPYPLSVWELHDTSNWSMRIQGLLHGKLLPVSERIAEEEIPDYRKFLNEVMSGFRLTREDGTEAGLFKVNALAHWYTHNMLVHYSMPHGLEQYGGAAWGTRDVCQGPVEYFMATGKWGQVRDILLTVYSHQYAEDGGWPQWFMFDDYSAIQQEESHGDIIVWPLKVLADYLTSTGDMGVLYENVRYTTKGGFQFTDQQVPLMEHVMKQIGYIRARFLHGTRLSSYGDGDWDDTLQPADAKLKTDMASSWTVALTYQSMNRLARVLAKVDPERGRELQELADGIREDFHDFMVVDGVIPGFLYMEDPGKPVSMLHPSDRETGISYRLLPMTRSIISELLRPDQVKTHMGIIERELMFPDGVRLMNRPASYNGGVSRRFKRAEQAANFGREIGLMYTHAHIRYVEAMAKLGRSDAVWSGLETINPVGIREAVPHAELRQANAYFSSSDGAFRNRYEAEARFEQLRSGSVPVKAGWRIYSSGPGIYMNQLISQALGVRQERGDLILDPVLPEKLDGLCFDFECLGRTMRFVYRIAGVGQVRTVWINGREVPLSREENPYRPGGVRVLKNVLEEACSEGENLVEILM